MIWEGKPYLHRKIFYNYKAIRAMYKAKFLSPMIPSFNIEETVSFFKNLLGFEVLMNDETYAILCKDNSMVHILPAGADIGEMEFYMEVDDIEQLWNSIKDKVKDMKVKGPFDREYGMREIHIIVPQTMALMFIGQAIKSS
jgi:hypothetical protein